MHHYLRHGRFVLIYNANLDRPESSSMNLAGIRRQLRKWEEMQTLKKPGIDDTRAYLVRLTLGLPGRFYTNEIPSTEK